MSRMAEINRLCKELDRAGIPYESADKFHGTGYGYTNVGYPSRDDCVCSVVQHETSWSLEIVGLTQPNDEMLGDSITPHLSSQEVFSRIRKHWEATRQGGGEMKELTEADLLPCKNCGESDFDVGSSGWEIGFDEYYFNGDVRCRNCLRYVQESGAHHKDAQQAAMRAWNQEQEETK